MPASTPTSYLLLALMGLRPWSAYELAEQMTRGLQFIWPRAERVFYYEAKKLAEAGLAEATADAVGARGRSVYTLTDAGRDALRAWLADRAPQPPQFESEAMLRIFFCEYGGHDDLLAAAASVAAAGRAVLDQVRRSSQEYLDTEGIFPERLHLIALAGQWLYVYGDMLLSYGEWVRDVVAQWDSTQRPADVTAVRELLRQARDAAERRLNQAASPA